MKVPPEVKQTDSRSRFLWSMGAAFFVSVASLLIAPLVFVVIEPVSFNDLLPSSTGGDGFYLYIVTMIVMFVLGMYLILLSRRVADN